MRMVYASLFAMMTTVMCVPLVTHATSARKDIGFLLITLVSLFVTILSVRIALLRIHAMCARRDTRRVMMTVCAR